MNFASAFISMTRGHKVARSHWSGYWHIVDGIIMIHTKDGIDLKLTDSDDIVYTISIQSAIVHVMTGTLLTTMELARRDRIWNN